MVDHGVKLTWMIILTAGALCTWPVLWALAKITGCWWIPVTFGAGMTTLILAFDLGMLWNLNPYEFPVWFCLAQMTTVALSLAVIVGVTAAWYYAALAAAVWPLQRGSALRWRHWFILPVVIIPVSSTALQMAFTVKYNAYVQIGYDNTFCDVTEPLWPKLLGWGAMPLFCITPCVIFTIYSIPKLRRTMRVHQSLWADMANQFRIERPPVSPPPIRTRPRSREDPSSSNSDSTAPLHPMYGLIPMHSLHTPSGLGPPSPQHDTSARNSTMSSLYSLDATTNDDVAILHLYKSSLLYLTSLDETEAPIGQAPSHTNGDVSSYGGALGDTSYANLSHTSGRGHYDGKYALAFKPIRCELKGDSTILCL
ncbi:hypothetical protein FIBSPDRAFT_1052740 [Athelia psychrophila]|uniref:Uncharacterized protein n=1 Tax=Athelia psychrophila TaxID=1759441 RepID=A0A165WQN5_9AGAM|nr:hypothetical protein FIBSPDRAFT_1052740 [Fibularhizoctonia sp. CBS 109695]